MKPCTTIPWCSITSYTMFDIEPFQRQCDLLARCSQKRAVLNTVASALTLLCHSLPIDGIPRGRESSTVALEALVSHLLLCLFAVMKWMLLKRRPPQFIVRGLNTLSQALFSWAVTIARSSIWLHMHRRSKLAKQVGRMMPAFIRAIWWPDAATKREEALDTFLRMQLAALSKPNTQDDCAWLYCWWQHGFRYVGMARARRADACVSGGPLCRFVEHLSLRTRPHHRDAQKLRYRRARSHSGGSFWWLPTFVGHTPQVAAMEQLEIKLHLPNANGPARAGMLDKPCKVQRKRPPRWRRLRCSGRAPPAHAAWEGHIGGSQLTKGMASFESADVDLSQWCFCQAYRHIQRCQMGAEATMGPLSIYSPAVQQLFLLWAAAGNEIDWGLLEKCWKVPCGPVALAKLCHMAFAPQTPKGSAR